MGCQLLAPSPAWATVYSQRPGGGLPVTCGGQGARCAAQPSPAQHLLTEAVFVGHVQCRVPLPTHGAISSGSFRLASAFICRLTMKSLRTGTLLLNEPFSPQAEHSALARARAHTRAHTRTHTHSNTQQICSAIRSAVARSFLWPWEHFMQTSTLALGVRGPGMYFRVLLLLRRFAKRVFQSLRVLRVWEEV